ncbi:MAG TPA: DNA-binding domain-containing protein [Methyloversatilis sp.]
MSALGQLQQQFIAYLHDRPNALLEALADTGGLARNERANIYFNAYRVRLVDALKDSFDKTWAWLGDEGFESAGLGYIATHPPAQFSLRAFGDRFADWLASARPGDPELAELARLDWALRNAFDGADAEPLTGASLAGFTERDWADVVFRPHPTAQLLPVTLNTVDLWHAMDSGIAPPDVRPLADAGWLLVWRKGLQPHFRSLGDAEAQLLFAMQRGERFAASCEQLAGDMADHAGAQSLIGHLLARWLEDGVLCA